MFEKLKGTLAVVGKGVFVLLAVAVLMGSNCHPQMPIGVKPGSAVWVTIYDRDSIRIVGYVLATGTVDQRAPLTTTKGVFAVESMTEHWFASNNADLVASPEQLRGLKWSVQTAEGTGWRTQMRGYIEQSAGLMDSTEPIRWDLKAPSGAVPWAAATATPMEGLSVFEYEGGDGSWQLGLTRINDALSGAAWGSPHEAGEYTLPDAFTQAGAITLERNDRATPVAVFDDHEVASP